MRERVKNRIDDVLGMIQEDGIVQSYPTSAINLLPFMKNCEIIEYRTFARASGVSIQEIAMLMQSQDGCTTYDRVNDRYLIAVNTDRMPARVEWTIAHEIGHVVAGHLLEFDSPHLPRKRYLEEEADYFAANFLAPLYAICLLRVTSQQDLQKKFGLSRTAAYRRWEEYQQSGFGWREHACRQRREFRPVNVWPDEGENFSL